MAQSGMVPQPPVLLSQNELTSGSGALFCRIIAKPAPCLQHAIVAIQPTSVPYPFSESSR